MLHRQEPAMKHQERVQTLCDVNMHYFGNSLSLEYERFDPRDEVMVEQQHCGGNTLIVFREKILPGSKLINAFPNVFCMHTIFVYICIPYFTVKAYLAMSNSTVCGGEHFPP